MKTITSKGTTGMETIQECSPSFLWCEQRSICPKSPPTVLPASQDICRWLRGNFSNRFQPKERCEKISLYWKAQRSIWSAPRGMFDPRQIYEPNIQDQSYFGKVFWILQKNKIPPRKGSQWTFTGLCFSGKIFCGWNPRKSGNSVISGLWSLSL